MKKVFKFMAFCAAVFVMFGCANELNESKLLGSEKCGSLRVVSGDERALEIDEIKFASVVVSGSGIKEGSEPKALNVVIDKGKSDNIEITGIPEGKNRIVTVQALKENKSEIYAITMRAIVDIEAGKSTTVAVNWSTTPLGNVYNKLYLRGKNISDLTLNDKTSISNAIDSTVSPFLIDYDSIATDFMNGSLADSNQYVLSTSSLSIECNEMDNFRVQVCDPSSNVVSVEGPATTAEVTGIAPGTWKVYLIDKEGKKIEKTAIFTSDNKVNLSFVAPTDKIIVHAYNYTTIWSWTESPAQNFTGGTWPGLAMEKENDAWYKFELPLEAEMVIFSNKGSGQTANLVLPGAGEWWYKDGSWYGEDPSDNEAPSIVSFTPSVDISSAVSGKVNFTLTASDNKKLSKAYFKVNNTLYKTAAFSELSNTVTVEWDSTLYKNGSYTISVYVEDASKNVSEEESISLTTVNENLPPIPAITGPSKIGTGGKTQTYKSSSYDPNGTIMSYKWEVTGATIEGDSDKSEVKVKFPENAVSGIKIKLTVTDDDGASAFITKDVVVEQLKAIDFREETIYFAMTTRFFDGDNQTMFTVGMKMLQLQLMTLHGVETLKVLSKNLITLRLLVFRLYGLLQS